MLESPKHDPRVSEDPTPICPKIFQQDELNATAQRLVSLEQMQVLDLDQTEMAETVRSLFAPFIGKLSQLKIDSLHLIKSEDECSAAVRPFFETVRGLGSEKDFDFREINPSAKSNDFVKDSFYREDKNLVVIGIEQEFLGNQCYLLYVVSGSPSES